MVTIYPNMEENYKLLEFILKNKVNKKIVKRSTLIKLTRNESLSSEEEKELIRVFCAHNYSFVNYDLELFRNSIECTLSSIRKDSNSVQELPKSFEVGYEDAIFNSLKPNYYITAKTPFYLRGLFKLALRSVEKDIFSVDYLDYNSLSDNEKNIIVEKICSSNKYYINEDTPDFLRDSKDITEVSYKNNPSETILYCNNSLLPNKYIIDMIDKGKDITQELSVNHLEDKEINKKLFSYKGRKRIDKAKYNDRVSALISKAVSTPLTIENMHDYGRVVGYMEMKKNGETANPFSLISSSLRANTSYNVSLNDLYEVLNGMKEELPKDKVEALHDAMGRYHELYHNEGEPEKQNKYLSLISSICSLYYSQCIENELESGYDHIRNYLLNYYILRKDNKAVKSYIMSKRYIKTIKRFYLNGSFDEFVNYLKDKYGDSELVDALFESVCEKDEFNTPGKPEEYDTYCISKEVNKLVNRLNSGYIKYTDKDVERFKKYIKKCTINGKITYKNNTVKVGDIDECVEYEKKLYLSKRIVREIIMKAKEVNEDNEIYNFQLADIDESNFCFNDDFYRFNYDEVSDNIVVHLLNSSYTDPDYNIKLKLPFAVNDILDDEKYNAFTKLMCDKGLFWIFLFFSNNNRYYFSYDQILSFGKAYNLLKEMGINDINYYNYLTSIDIVNNCSKEELAILEDLDVIHKVIYSTEYTSENTPERVEIAAELVAQMAEKNISTVPYIKGSTNGYNYFLYDSQDPSILVSGIDTDACFKVSGNDNDFLHYCAINPNGFVIKITDNEGKFIARASGLRHGNSIYLNQLRTIYDVAMNSSDYTASQLTELRKVVIKASEDFINISSSTEPEDNQIENVFITKSYGFNTYKSNVGINLRREIGELSFVEGTEDFEEFLECTENLDIGKLTTDYCGSYPIICLASKYELNEYGEYDKKNYIKKYDAEAYYKRTRNKIIFESNPSKRVVAKINKINAISSKNNEELYEEYIPDKSDFVFVGDNWYIIVGDNKCRALSLPFDEDANNEICSVESSILNDKIIKVDGNEIEGDNVNVYIRRKD